MTIKDIAQNLGASTDSIASRFRRAHKANLIPKYTSNDEIPEDLANWVLQNKPIRDFVNQGAEAVQVEDQLETEPVQISDQLQEGNEIEEELKLKIEELESANEDLYKLLADAENDIKGLFNRPTQDEHEVLKNLVEQTQKQRDHALERLKEKEDQSLKLKNTGLLRAALVFLALPAAYCVFVFASAFVPFWVACIEAAAFEATYIGIALVKNFTPEKRTLAKRIIFGAVAVSMVYGSIAAQLHMNPTMMVEMEMNWSWAVSILYGCPLGLIAYGISNLLFHE